MKNNALEVCSEGLSRIQRVICPLGGGEEEERAEGGEGRGGPDCESAQRSQGEHPGGTHKHKEIDVNCKCKYLHFLSPSPLLNTFPHFSTFDYI